MAACAPPSIDWPVHTERLVLRPIEPARDLPAIWEIRRDPGVNRWLGSHYPDEAAFMAARRTVLPPPSQVVVVELDGRVVGDMFLKVEDGWGQKDVTEQVRDCQAEAGWTFHADVHGRGYGTEAVTALVDLAFGPLGLRRVHAGCFAGNTPSWRLMERIGMRRECHSVRECLHRDLGWVDGYMYAVLADEWPTRRLRGAGRVG